MEIDDESQNLINKADVICKNTDDLYSIPYSESKENIYVFIIFDANSEINISYCLNETELVKLMESSKVGVWISAEDCPPNINYGRLNIDIFKFPHTHIWIKKFNIPMKSTVFILYKEFQARIGNYEFIEMDRPSTIYNIIEFPLRVFLQGIEEEKKLNQLIRSNIENPPELITMNNWLQQYANKTRITNSPMFLNVIKPSVRCMYTENGNFYHASATVDSDKNTTITLIKGDAEVYDYELPNQLEVFDILCMKHRVFISSGAGILEWKYETNQMISFYRPDHIIYIMKGVDNICVMVEGDSTIVVKDIVTNIVYKKTILPENFEIENLTVSPISNIMVIFASRKKFNSGKIFLYSLSLESINMILEFKHQYERFYDGIFTLDGSLVIGCSLENIYIWDTSGKIQSIIYTPRETNNIWNRIGVTLNNKKVILVGEYVVQIWNLETSELNGTFKNIYRDNDNNLVPISYFPLLYISDDLFYVIDRIGHLQTFYIEQKHMPLPEKVKQEITSCVPYSDERLVLSDFFGNIYITNTQLRIQSKVFYNSILYDNPVRGRSDEDKIIGKRMNQSNKMVVIRNNTIYIWDNVNNTIRILLETDSPVSTKFLLISDDDQYIFFVVDSNITKVDIRTNNVKVIRIVENIAQLELFLNKYLIILLNDSKTFELINFTIANLPSIRYGRQIEAEQLMTINYVKSDYKNNSLLICLKDRIVERSSQGEEKIYKLYALNNYKIADKVRVVTNRVGAILAFFTKRYIFILNTVSNQIIRYITLEDPNFRVTEMFIQNQKLIVVIDRVTIYVYNLPEAI